MNILFLATRWPWPPVDGGRVLMAATLEGLRDRGHRVTLIAPAPDAAPVPESLAGAWLQPVRVAATAAPLPLAVLAGLPRAVPGSVARHAHRTMTSAVREHLERQHIDCVHVQQLHAVVHAEPCMGRVPIVLRAENVESDLWAAAARDARWTWPLVRHEALKLARWEAAALARATATVALSTRDARRLRFLAPNARIEVVRAPVRSVLPSAPHRLAGAPALVLLGSPWRPNQQGATWFVRRVWPAVLAALPAARLHVFGAADVPRRTAGVVRYAAPDDARSIFAPNAVFVVSPQIASGTSMRLLEAMARGVPVVATSQALDGLDADAPPPVARADDAAAYVDAVRRLTSSDEARCQAIDAARGWLRTHHEPRQIAEALEQVYERARCDA